MQRITMLTAFALLAFPASSMAAGTNGTVLSVDSHHHAIQVVDATHVVHAYQYQGRLPRVSTGSKITFKLGGSTISHVKAVAKRSHSVSYYARVVKSSHSGLVLALSDGKQVHFNSGQLTHKLLHAKHSARLVRSVRANLTAAVSAGNVTVNILGLEPGVTVMVTQSTDANGNVTITITLPTTGPGGQPVGGGSGQDEIGTITKVSSTSVTVNTQDNGPMTFLVDTPDVSSGFAVGDVVDVTYDQLSSGALDASDIEYVQSDGTGVVTAVSTGSITFTDDSTGQPVTFTANPSDLMFDGVAVGDWVDVTYHISAGQTVVDQVDDQGPPSSSSSGSGD
ncbi:MAG: hypothetical protein ACYDHH_09560 [Solirubrobacteraceae bacterium]